jgi:hypothetical protein
MWFGFERISLKINEVRRRVNGELDIWYVLLKWEGCSGLFYSLKSGRTVRFVLIFLQIKIIQLGSTKQLECSDGATNFG